MAGMGGYLGIKVQTAAASPLEKVAVHMLGADSIYRVVGYTRAPDGLYHMPGAVPGTFTFMFIKAGYTTATSSITITDATVTETTITLTKV